MAYRQTCGMESLGTTYTLPEKPKRMIYRGRFQSRGLRSGGLASLADMPPIFYHVAPTGDSDKTDWPDFSQESMEDIQRKLAAVMTDSMAETILSQQGKDEIKRQLFRACRSTASYETGLFTDGSNALDDVCGKWADQAFPQYEEAAIAFLEGTGGAGGSGGGAQQAGFGWGTALLALGGIAGAGYAVYQITQ